MINDILYEKICHLKENFGLIAIKAEFEAEGSTFRDIVRLRSITRKAGVDLVLKISGTEAVRDIKDALELDIDGIIVPMVENSFSMRKFFQAYTKIYDGEKRFLTVNIESKYALDNIDEILSECNEINNITFGRTDLSDSYNKGYKVDDDFISNLVIEYGTIVKNYGFTTTLGGSVSKDTVAMLKSREDIRKLFDRIETRKIIIPMDSILKQNALREIFEFEKLYILSKKEIIDICLDPEMKRLVELERRLFLDPETKKLVKFEG